MMSLAETMADIERLPTGVTPFTASDWQTVIRINRQLKSAADSLRDEMRPLADAEASGPTRPMARESIKAVLADADELFAAYDALDEWYRAKDVARWFKEAADTHAEVMCEVERTRIATQTIADTYL
jgi:hypothetical protein